MTLRGGRRMYLPLLAVVATLDAVFHPAEVALEQRQPLQLLRQHPLQR